MTDICNRLNHFQSTVFKDRVKLETSFEANKCRAVLMKTPNWKDYSKWKIQRIRFFLTIYKLTIYRLSQDQDPSWQII